MKITFNGKITAGIIDTMLDEQEKKKQKIIAFCKNNKVQELQYKDSELEFDYKFKEEVETRPQASKKVETRGGAKNVKG